MKDDKQNDRQGVALSDAEQHTVADLRSYARSIRMIEDNQGAAMQDCIEAATAMEWAALQIEGLRHQISRASSSRAEVEIPEPVAWIEKGQLEAVRDESSDAWVYWRESGHIAEPDEVALYIRPQSVPRAMGDEQIESAIEGSGGAWHEDEFRICGKDLMAMCRALAAAEAPKGDQS